MSVFRGLRTYLGTDWPWLGAILLIALGVRFWGLDFGLPNEHARPDERHLIGYTLTLGSNKLNPGFFSYPSLYLYMLFAAYCAYFALGRATGHFSSVQDLVAEYSVAPDRLYLIDRSLVAILGVLTVAATYDIGRRAVGRRAGLIAALFLSVAYLHARDSHFGTVDVPMTFFSTLAIALVLRADEARTTRSILLAGAAAGLAVSTKYNALALVAPLALLQFLPRPLPEPTLGERISGFGVAVAALLVLFVVGTPFSVFDSSRFLKDVGFEFLSKSREVPKVDNGPGWLYHLEVTLPYGVGFPLLLAATVGVVVALRERWRTALLVLAFPGVWYVGVGMSHFVYARYAVPVIPAICVFAAWAVEAGVRALEGSPSEERSAKARYVLAGLVAVVLAVPALRIADWNRLVRRTDTRVLVVDWFERHVPSGASIGVVGWSYVRPQLRNAPPQLLRSREGNRSRGHQLRTEFTLAHLKRTGAPAYETYVFDKGSWRDTLNPDHVAPDLPSYVVLAEHPVWKPEPGELPILGAEYSPVAAFDGYAAPAARAVYDWQDAVYFPFANFDGVTRPGPNLRVFRRVR